MITSLLMAAALAATFENQYVRMTLEETGCVASLYEKKSSRELIAGKAPFVFAEKADGTRLEPVSLEAAEADGVTRLDFGFAGGGHARIDVSPFAKGTGWNVTLRGCDVKEAEWLTFARIAPVCAAKRGKMSNIVMDGTSAVAIRAYDMQCEMDVPNAPGHIYVNNGETHVYVNRKYGFEGFRAGLAVAPRGEILAVLKDMLAESGVVSTGCGGPYSLESEGNRRSYLLATWMDSESVDDWIRLLDKSGCQMMHLHAWWKTRGSYEPDVCFPGGFAQMKEVVDRLHARGNSVSTHTLSPTIQFGDPLIDKRNFEELIYDAEYTLARPYRAGDDVLYVNEVPVAKHAKMLTGDTNGNILLLGDNLIQYSDFSREKPYRFTGVRMALEPWGEQEVFDATQAVQTQREGEVAAARSDRKLSQAEYPAGARVRYLHHRYASFFARPGTKLARTCIDNIVRPYNDWGLEGIFLDGAEGFGERYAVDWFRTAVTSALKPSGGEVFNHSSYRHPFNWWQRSIFGGWDHPMYGPKPFHRRHLRTYYDICEADFLQKDMGWWNTRAASASGRGYFPDEMEYFCCKSAAYDATSSLIGTSAITDGPLPFLMDDQVTIFGWWTGARYARAFRPELLARMKPFDGDEWRLRQDASGEWRATPFSSSVHKVPTADFAAWQVASAEVRPAELRVEALYSVDRAGAATNTLRVLDAGMLPGLKVRSAGGVKARADAVDSPHGRAIRFTAANESAAPDASWACLSRKLPEKVFDRANPVSALWVKGDGSGAVLNVQVSRAAEFSGAYSENFVKLDFTGWRRVELLLRERDCETADSYRWPYLPREQLAGPGVMYRTSVFGKVVGGYNLYLNGIAKGGSTTVEVGAWEGLPQCKETMAAGAVVTLNGERFEVPFALAGGEWAELKGGAWWHYAESGRPLERRVAAKMPHLKAGANDCAFEGRNADGFARAEVTVFGIGRDEGAFVELDGRQRKLLRTEYEFPAILDPAKGLTGPFAVRVRPGETARVGFEILGPAKNPVVQGRRMEIELKDAQERILCEDGRTWKAVRIVPGANNGENRTKQAVRQPIGEGTFEPLPLLKSGTAEFTVASEVPGARVTFFKSYEEEK